MITNKVRYEGTNRKTAAVVGVLFIIGTVSGVLGAVLGEPVLGTPDYLSKLSANEGSMLSYTLLMFIMGVACAGIGLALYPILKKYNEGLAIGAVGFRIIEGMGDIVAAIGVIALLALSQEFLKAGAPDASYFQTAGVVINAGIDWLCHGAMLLCWVIGACIYYSLFYQYRLVPRWLSVWGLVGIALVTIGGVLVMLHVIPGFGTVQMVLNLPIFPQEMVLAVWLIVKGVNSSAVASEAAKTATNELLSAA
jgi:hypothetical protein